MNIEEIVNRTTNTLNAAPEEKKEMSDSITDIIEKEVLYRLSANERLSSYLEQNSQASLINLATALENNNEYQDICRTSVLTIIGDWVRSISPSLSEEETKRLSDELARIAQQLQDT